MFHFFSWKAIQVIRWEQLLLYRSCYKPSSEAFLWGTVSHSPGKVIWTSIPKLSRLMGDMHNKGVCGAFWLSCPLQKLYPILSDLVDTTNSKIQSAAFSPLLTKQESANLFPPLFCANSFWEIPLDSAVRRNTPSRTGQVGYYWMGEGPKRLDKMRMISINMRAFD